MVSSYNSSNKYVQHSAQHTVERRTSTSPGATVAKNSTGTRAEKEACVSEGALAAKKTNIHEHRSGRYIAKTSHCRAYFSFDNTDGYGPHVDGVLRFHISRIGID